jgi:hypothetical protein
LVKQQEGEAMGRWILGIIITIVVVWAVLRFGCIPKMLKAANAVGTAVGNIGLTPEQLAVKAKYQAAIDTAKASGDKAALAAAKAAKGAAKANGWKA